MRKKIAGIILAALILLPFGGNVVQAAASCGGNPGVTVYQDTYLNGLGRQFCGTANGGPINYDLRTVSWSDRISSYWFYNSHGKSLRLYENTNFGGLYITTTGDEKVNDLRLFWENRLGDGFNDVITSFRVLN